MNRGRHTYRTGENIPAEILIDNVRRRERPPTPRSRFLGGATGEAHPRKRLVLSDSGLPLLSGDLVPEWPSEDEDEPHTEILEMAA